MKARDKQPEFVLRHVENGRIFGYDERLAKEPTLEKVRFEVACPELCMPDHVKKRIAKAKKAPAKKAPAKKAPAKKASTEKASEKKPTVKKKAARKKAPLDLSTDDADIGKDPDEVLAGGDDDDLTSEIDKALSADASEGLD